MQRKKYKVRIQGYRNSKYFKPEESKETLVSVYHTEQPIENRTYTYKTGAMYSGEWKGGMRHGKGKIVWEDGAKYEGDWELNFACG